MDDTIVYEEDDINQLGYEFSFMTDLFQGVHTLMIEAWDKVGNYLKKEVDIILPVQATINITPDTLNLRSKGKWITAYIELPEGYAASDIDITTVLLNDVIQAEPKPVAIGDSNRNGINDLMVKFDRMLVLEILTSAEKVEITISGEVAGIVFEGTDIVRVKNK